MPKNDEQFTKELVQNSSQTQGSQTTESQIQQHVSNEMPWWGYILAGAGIFAAGKIGGGIARSIDLLAGEASVAKAEMSAAEAAKKYGTITAKDITSTIFGKLSFTSGMIGKPNVFLSNKLFDKIPSVYSMMFNTTTAGSLAAKAIRSIPGVASYSANAVDFLVSAKDKAAGKGEVFHTIAATIRSKFAGISSNDTVDILIKNASRKSNTLFENEGYFVPRFVKQMNEVSQLMQNADAVTADEIKQSVNQFLQKQTESIKSKTNTLSFFGLTPLSYAEHLQRFNKEIPKDLESIYARVRKTIGGNLPEWKELLQMPASPDVFETNSGRLTHVYNPEKIIVDQTRKLLQNVNIPYLGFNPLTLLQPGLVEEMADQRFVVELNTHNYVPYKNGMTTVGDIAKSLSMPENSKMVLVGGKAYMQGEGVTKPLKELGEVHALRSRNVSSAINRIYAFETGMYRGGVQKADLPLNNKNDIEGSMLEELKTSYKRATHAKLKRWKKAFAGKDALELLSTLAEMHNVNQNTLTWKIFAEQKGVYDLPINEQLDKFRKYVSSAHRDAKNILKVRELFTPSQRNNLYHFFSPTSKEQKLYDIILSKDEEAVTARYLNQDATAGLSFRDVLAIGTLKYNMQEIPTKDLSKFISPITDAYGKKSTEQNIGKMGFLHIYTNAIKSRLGSKANVGDWINDFSKLLSNDQSKISSIPFGKNMYALLEEYSISTKSLYKNATGATFTQRFFNNVEHSTKNISKLSSSDYLVIGKYRSPWETKAQGGTLKDWFLQLATTPKTFSKRSSVPGLISHWLMERPYDLLEYTGLGRPNYSTSYNATSTVGALLLRKILPLSIATASAGYASYLINKYTGVDVKKPVFDYAKRVGIGALRLGEYTGVIPLVQSIQKHYPGIMSIGAFLYGQYSSNIRTAMLLGSIASFAENVPSARKTALSWYGVNQVPVRTGRWWEIGNDPFQGGRIKYYRPSLAYLSTSDWQYSSTLWGNKTNYWKYGSMLPTPTNLFDVLPLLYRDKFLGTMHQKDRPYGFVGTGIMNTQAEQQLKQSTGMGAIYGGINAIASYKRSNSIATQTVKQLQREASIMRANSLKASMSFISKYAEEYPGMPGFLASAVVSNISNKRQMYLANPSYMGSAYRQYYQKELGSMLGMTELFRRMMPNQHPWYNTITGNKRNTQPQWLPQRFQYGDPYAQLEFGEVRLPGEAYLMTHPLSGGKYSLPQQMQIAANVSPRSSSYDKIVSELQQSPPRTAGERYTMFMAAKEHQGILTGNAESFSPYSIKLAKEKIKLGKYIGQGIFENPDNPRSVISFAGTQESQDAIAANLFQTKNITLSTAYAEAEEREKKIDVAMQKMSNSTITAIVPKDISARYRMLMDGGLVEEIYNKGATKQLLDLGAMPVDNTTMSYYATHNALFSSIWQKARHLDNFLIQKFGGSESALEYYKRHLYSGTMFQNWSTPISSFVLPAILKPTGEGFFNAMSSTFYTGMFGSANPIEAVPAVLGMSLISGLSSLLPSIPTPENKKRIELENKYMLAEYYSGKNNLFGDQLPSLKNIEKELPQPESEYFAQFLNAPSGKRSEISRIVPDAERYLLQEYWNLKDMDATGNLHASSVLPIAESINKSHPYQTLSDVNTQSSNLNLTMTRSSYADKISIALNSMHDQSMIQPTYSSAGIDLVHKQKRGSEMAHFYGANNTTIGYSGNNSLNMRGYYGR